MDVVTLGAAKAQGDKRYTRGAPWLYLPQGWDTTWKAAKVAQGTTPAQVLGLGDSVLAGQGSTDWLNNAWFGKTRTAILAAPGNSLCADYYPSAVFGITNANRVGATPYTTLITAGSVVEGGYGRCVICNSGGAPSMVFTSLYNCVAMDLIYIDYATGSFTYSVDGGSAVTVNTTGPGTQAGAQVKKIAITGLSGASTHTISAGAGSGSNALVIAGVSTYASGTGIRFARMGYPGMRFVDLLTTRGPGTGASGVASFPTDKIALLQGQNPGGDTPTTPTGFGFPTQPHLAIIEMGLNDVDNGAPARNYHAALRRTIYALRRGQPGCSIAILAVAHPDGVYSDNNPGGRGYDWYKFKTVMAAAAHTYQCAYVDIDAKWGQTPFGQGFMLASADLHPTDAGHADIAAVLSAIL